MTYSRPRLVALAMLLLVPSLARAEHRLSLDEAYAMALRTNPALELLRERVHQAEVARYRAWSALKPTAGFQGTFTHYDQEVVIDFAESSPVAIPGAEPIVIQKQNQFAFNVNANLPLFRGAAYPRVSMAKKGVLAARLQEVRSRQDFLLKVAQAYYLVVSREEAVRALEYKHTVDLKHLAAAKAQLEVGQSPRAVVLRADLVATQDAQNLRAQRNALDAARKQLAILVGAPGPVAVTRPPEPPDAKASASEMVQTALAERPDLKATGVAIDIAKQSKKAAWLTFAPGLDLTWLYRWSEAAGFAGERGSWNLCLTLNVPIFDGGLRYADLREARSKIAEARAQREALTLEIEGEIVRLRAEVDSANAGVVSATQAVRLAKVTAEDMDASFSVGAATQLDVLDADQRLLDAQLALTSSLYNRDLARLALLHAQGQFNPVGS